MNRRKKVRQKNSNKTGEIVWSTRKKKFGWYIVSNWEIDGEEKYIGPYETEENAILNAKKKKIELIYDGEKTSE